jgi:teichuronic acid biosynthesis glycosyltransferase TuaC
VRVLVFTTLYPNAADPANALFVEQRLRQLVATGAVETRVVAPVPWFPLRHPRFGRYTRFARAPANEIRHGIPIAHPRYLVVPKLGMLATPYTLARAGKRAIDELRRTGWDFDLIDAHYFYPDGIAATLLSQWYSKPVVITARGTDINLIPQSRLPRRMILWAAHRAAASITVCAALKDELVALGADAAKITVLRNGVDLELFRPMDRAEARKQLAVSGPLLLSVGHLNKRKGHHVVLDALRELTEYRLLIVGDGEMASALRKQASRIGVEDRVRFVGAVAPQQLPTYFNAADMLVLASSREGWANVLLESMACGTPVVATDVWGTREVVTSPVAGQLVGEVSSSAIVAGVRALAQAYPDRAATRRYAEGFSWDATSMGQLDLFRRILARGAAA